MPNAEEMSSKVKNGFNSSCYSWVLVREEGLECVFIHSLPSPHKLLKDPLKGRLILISNHGKAQRQCPAIPAFTGKDAYIHVIPVGKNGVFKVKVSCNGLVTVTCKVTCNGPSPVTRNGRVTVTGNGWVISGGKGVSVTATCNGYP